MINVTPEIWHAYLRTY